MMKPTVLIIGGNVNSTLRTWLQELGVTTFNHLSVQLTEISPEDLRESAQRLREILPPESIILTSGVMADKLLNMVFVVHGALPSTSTDDKKRIAAAIGQCRNYLTMRSYYGAQSTGSRIS